MHAIMTAIKLALGKALTALLPHWRIWAVVLSAATIICAASYYRMRAVTLRREVADLEASLKASETRAAVNAATITLQRQQYDQRLAAVQAAATCELTRTKSVSAIKEKVKHAEDAPIAPVLRDALDGLRAARSPTGDATAR